MSIVPSIFRRPSAFDLFSMDIRDPFEALRDISPTSTRANEVVSAVANAQIDWKETENAHVFKADLPGLRKEEVKVEIQDSNVLQISGERNKEEEEKNDKWHRVERARGKFVRRFRLPDNAKTDEIRASMDNGVLTVNVPKRPQPQPQVKSIDISG